MLSILVSFSFTLATLASGQAVPPISTDVGVKAEMFDISQVSLPSGRFGDNQARTLNYLKFVDPERLLYNFRNTHKLDTQGAQPIGGWDAPDFPFRSHMQGHVLSAWSQCWNALKDTDCRDRATYFVAELQKCQNNNGAAGFSNGYLSGFPESDVVAVENGQSSTVVYYSIHKTMAGLLDVWRFIGDETARNVLLPMAEWVDERTAKFSYDQMQRILSVEYGGMQDTLADIYRQTGDQKWIAVAQRFDQEATNSFLAANENKLNGLHANTQIPKWIGAIREYKATGAQKYLDIARNAWEMTVSSHTYAIGANSQNEHFHGPNEISGWLTYDTAEHCNTYNMLKLSKELWSVDPNPKYMDFYERALQNHAIGAQDPDSQHGHITYFSPLNPGGRKGVGPKWGGGTWSTDYDTMWCCQGSGVEQNTRLMDSIYGHDDTTLFVNMFVPSTLNWAAKGLHVSQTGQVPLSDTVTISIAGSGPFDMNIRIPDWASAASVAVNGAQQNVAAEPGTYTTISRDWANNDQVTVKLTIEPYLIHSNDNQNVSAIAYGPTILIGDYGDTNLDSAPTLQLNTLRRVSSDALDFTATANDQNVELGPYQDGGSRFNYVTYWSHLGDFE